VVITHEVGVTGGVQKIDLDAVVHHGCDGEVDGSLLLDLDLVEVGDRVAVLDASRALDGARRGQQLLDEGRLACS
jgi:hypothetical protein